MYVLGSIVRRYTDNSKIYKCHFRRIHSGLIRADSLTDIEEKTTKGIEHTCLSQGHRLSQPYSRLHWNIHGCGMYISFTACQTLWVHEI